MKLNSFGMKSHPKRYENTLIEGMKIHSKVWKWCRRYEKIPMIPRYEKDAQGMKKMHKVWKMCPRYTTNPQRYENAFTGMKKVFSWKTVVFHTFMGLFHTFLGIKKSLFFPDGINIAYSALKNIFNDEGIVIIEQNKPNEYIVVPKVVPWNRNAHTKYTQLCLCNKVWL